ncbi:MAG: IS66 family insertion sequence element accessory protein TnpB [Planctomycetes bacterium]|nr:IS66 family insertion sequence element accessory protein TnpB [Planctomycetota bacterium]
MLTPPLLAWVFVARDAVDFRKSHDGLFGIVSTSCSNADPMNGHPDVFFNKRRIASRFKDRHDCG